MKEKAGITLIFGLLLASLGSVPGCGRRILSAEELEKGRGFVETGLKAWQNGEKPASLQRLNPPIQFSDQDWSNGLRLTAWEITRTDGAAGDLTPRCEANLSLVDRMRNKITRRVVYQVDAKGGIRIVRDPYF